LQATQIAPNFSKIAENLQKGKRLEKTRKRKIGILDGKAKIEFAKDFEMTTEELLELR